MKTISKHIHQARRRRGGEGGGGERGGERRGERGGERGGEGERRKAQGGGREENVNLDKHLVLPWCCGVAAVLGY